MQDSTQIEAGGQRHFRLSSNNVPAVNIGAVDVQAEFVPDTLVVTKSLPTSRVGICGGGIAGLSLAIQLRAHGFEVTVFEKRHDPRSSESKDLRSYSVTIAGLGLASNPKLEARLHAEGQRLIGRRVYTSGRFFEQPYGLGPDDCFQSIPRHKLLQILAEEAVECGVEVRFNSEILNTDQTAGRLDWRLNSEPAIVSDYFDLLVFADGVTGMGRTLICRRPECSSHKVTAGQYVSAAVTPAEARRAALSCDHISFWPGADGPVIAIPNRDGSASILMVGPLPGPEAGPPFSCAEEASRFLEARSPALLEAVPELGVRLSTAARGNFCSATATHWTLGDRAVVIGDAGRCVPPYVGAGAALAMNDATQLVASLHASASLKEALQSFERNRRVATSIFFRMAEDHAKLLRRKIGSPRWRVISRLKLFAEKQLGLRDLYQTIVFDRHGLDGLVARQLAQPVQPEVAEVSTGAVSRFFQRGTVKAGRGGHSICLSKR